MKSPMLKVPATVEGLRALGGNSFVLELHITKNAVGFVPTLTRLEVAKLHALTGEALRATQDDIVSPELLGTYIP